MEHLGMMGWTLDSGIYFFYFLDPCLLATLWNKEQIFRIWTQAATGLAVSHMNRLFYSPQTRHDGGLHSHSASFYSFVRTLILTCRLCYLCEGTYWFQCICYDYITFMDYMRLNVCFMKVQSIVVSLPTDTSAWSVSCWRAIWRPWGHLANSGSISLYNSWPSCSNLLNALDRPEYGFHVL